MTNKQRSHIEFLCRQIEREQDESAFVQLVLELHKLIRLWLSELHETPETSIGEMDRFRIKPKVAGNGHRIGYEPYTVGSYEKIVDDALALMRSDYASLQRLYPERGTCGELQLVAFRGFDAQAARFWEWVREDSKSTCGIALRTSQRVVAPDIAVCDLMARSEDQQALLRAGIQASQSTPLFNRSGNLVGMISTHWHNPHQPSENDFRLFDILANQAAELIQREGRRQAP
jgi:GAF domain-containing protein